MALNENVFVFLSLVIFLQVSISYFVKIQATSFIYPLQIFCFANQAPIQGLHTHQLATMLAFCFAYQTQKFTTLQSYV